MSETYEVRLGDHSANDERLQPVILIEHCDPDMMHLYQRLFHDWGYNNLLSAHDHAEAVSLAERVHCDLIVLDIISPGGGMGNDATRAIKAIYEDRGGVPIIGTSTWSERAEELFMEAGADIFVPFPFRNDELRDVVQRLLPHAHTTTSRS